MVLPKTSADGRKKPMKAARLRKIARGRLAKAQVLAGKYEKTVGGIRAEGLMRNKRGKVVSKRQSARGKLAYKNVEDWTEALMAARAALHCVGFVAINGQSLQGKALYIKSKALREQRKSGCPASSSSQ
mmetsp:Transcript_124078/g.247154  ORF Transcript_124078/g.247154 Transcript_124078/m.247154 type:complete len:129 (+) Transcript_124078:84-470(+)